MANIKPLSTDLQQIANEKWNEVPERISQDLDAFKVWLQTQPHLKARTDDQFLLQFLRGCKYSLEKAKGKLNLFYSLKSKYPEMLNVTDVKNARFREINRLACFLPLPTPLNENGPRIVVFQYNYSTSQYNIEDIFQLGAAFHELMLINDPNAAICGLTYIIDFDKATANHFLQMSPSFCKKLVSFLEISMPLRMNSIYYINTPKAAQPFLNIVFQLFSEKLGKRIHIIGENMAEFQQHIPAKYLPQDYGGEKPSLIQLAAEFEQTWDATSDFFMENSNYGTDESLRVGKRLDLDGLFDVGGSFGKLIVD